MEHRRAYTNVKIESLANIAYSGTNINLTWIPNLFLGVHTSLIS